MRTSQKEHLAMANWIMFALMFFCSQILLKNYRDDIVLPTELPEKLSTEQQELKTKIIVDKLNNLPVYAFNDEYGNPLYRNKDGVLTETMPDWYQDGEVILSDFEKAQILDLTIIKTPGWMLDAEEMPASTYTNRLKYISLMLILGIIFGLLFLISTKTVLLKALVPVVGLIFGYVAGIRFFESITSLLAFLLPFFWFLLLVRLTIVYWPKWLYD